ncbi:glycine zipper 2TM domain-containing protein [Sphingomonas sp. BIUV-7]|uniref:17 kDa surface antigen n=1 Tax=Sphingomonas natans TaxID=3063330 RepID=A0ABT8YEQ1_9SPHN|nr:glycine zipper 2TM domain-containing protein [Sphingomonas sp. BIUV-7]MDO6416851.1 glycine zipper 2TM domain-containing protein [Sphingomonas sp. BIUV-7]
MRQWIFAAMIAATAPVALAAPAVAQSRGQVEARWADAQRRYQAETERYYAERDLYYNARGGPRGGYGAPPPTGAYGGGGYANDDRVENFDPAATYRPGQQERVLAPDERVYAGNDGRYYCKRSDGTTGLIAGGAAGGILGNVIDGGHSRTAGTLLGAAIGALAGKAVDQNQAQIKCR